MTTNNVKRRRRRLAAARTTSHSEVRPPAQPRNKACGLPTRRLEEALGRIREEYELRPRTGVAPSENKQAFLKREIYRLVRSYRGPKVRTTIELLVRRGGNAPATPLFADNPFHWALLAFDPKRVDGARQPALRHTAHQLLYADRHHVPEHLLVGFLYQIGASDDIYSRVDDQRREGWFEAYMRSWRGGRLIQSVTAASE